VIRRADILQGVDFYRIDHQEATNATALFEHLDFDSSSKFTIPFAPLAGANI